MYLMPRCSVEGRVCHRRLSPGNTVWYMEDSKPKSVLNNYDPSSLANGLPGFRGNEHTAMMPFMQPRGSVRRTQAPISP
ncbi:hypothetical protein BDR03DRAFT_943002 [Suillus americanus]|nr:hypothetical protein BDR03DRAFT_943002 [Suillus americanus]